MHPLLHLISTRPQLLAEHAEAYAELVGAEVPRIAAAWKRAALFNALALCSAAIALVLAGVSLLLWAVTLDAPVRALWVMYAVPLLPLAAAVAFALAARSGGGREAFEQLRVQVRADIRLLREVGAA